FRGGYGHLYILGPPAALAECNTQVLGSTRAYPAGAVADPECSDPWYASAATWLAWSATLPACSTGCRSGRPTAMSPAVPAVPAGGSPTTSALSACLG